MAPSRVLSCLDGGRSILVGSVDSDGAPSCCRGIGIRSEDGLETLTVYVPVATSNEVIANAATTRKIAVSSTEIFEHHSIQLKGTTTNVRLAAADEREFVRRSLEGFAASVAQFGLPRRITLSVAHWPAFAIEMKVEQVFDQTPGPQAGSAVK